MSDSGRGSLHLQVEPPGAAPAAPGRRLGRFLAARADPAGLLPALVLLAVLALLATYVAVTIVGAALTEKFRDDLAASRLSAGKAMVRLEEDNLRTLREMTFTIGVVEAIAGGDADRLESLLAPIAANSHVPYVDVLRADGPELLALRSPELGADAGQRLDPDARTWAPFQAVLRGDSDDQGDKYAGVVDTPWGPLFVTAAPVRQDGQLVGALGVGLPIGDVATRLSNDAGSQAVTLYRLDGTVVASTVRATPDALQRGWHLPAADVERLAAGDRLLLRQVSAGGTPFVETVGALAIRRQPALLLGIASPADVLERSTAQARNWMLLIFAAAAALAVALRLLARRAGGPAAPPAQMNRRVASEAGRGAGRSESNGG